MLEDFSQTFLIAKRYWKILTPTSCNIHLLTCANSSNLKERANSHKKTKAQSQLPSNDLSTV